MNSKFSLPVNQLPKLKKDIYDAYLSRGKISYGPTKNEFSNLQFRRSIYASKDIKKGEKFTRENIKVIRPNLGLKPKYYNYIIGKKQKKILNLHIQSNLKMLKNNQKLFKPCVIGLGYVGLPILLNLANKYPTHGYDINVKRINNLKKGIDTFNEYKKTSQKKETKVFI